MKTKQEIAKGIIANIRKGSYEDWIDAICSALNEFETQIEQSRKHGVMQAEGSDGVSVAAVASEGLGEANMCAGDKETQIIPRAVDYIEFMKEQYTPNPPNEPLLREGEGTEGKSSAPEGY